MDNKERLALLDKLHLCHKCEKAKPMKNRKFCLECLEKIALSNMKRYDRQKAHEYQTRRRQIYREKKEKGICIRCSKKATHGMYCLECSIKVKRRSQERAQKRKKERHEKGLIPEYRKEYNLCYYCGKPVEDAEKHGRACNDCANKMAEYSRLGDKAYWNGLDGIIFRKRDKND